MTGELLYFLWQRITIARSVTAICVSIDRLCTEFVVYLLIVLGLGTSA